MRASKCIGAGWLAWVAVLGLASEAGAAQKREGDSGREATLPKLPVTHSRFYDLYSRLDQDTLREAVARLTSVAKDYQRRTASFRHESMPRLPVYLFDSYEDYLAAGGPEKSCGLYKGTSVLGYFPKGHPDTLWPTLQHECWHQYVSRAVGGDWPAWLEEGLAEYYGVAIWTGDDLITGIVPPDYLERVQADIKERKLLLLTRLLNMDMDTWIANMSEVQYDQAWSLVHFLAHAESDKYRKGLVELIKEAAKSQPGMESFRRVFGAKYFEAQREYERWWMALTPEATRERTTRATVSTLTSFLARAHLKGMKFKDAEAFFAAAKDGSVLAAAQAKAALWLPKSLLERQLERAEKLQAWSLATAGKHPELRLRQDGAALVGRFELSPTKGIEVKVVSIKEKER